MTVYLLGLLPYAEELERQLLNDMDPDGRWRLMATGEALPRIGKRKAGDSNPNVRATQEATTSTAEIESQDATGEDHPLERGRGGEDGRIGKAEATRSTGAIPRRLLATRGPQERIYYPLTRYPAPSQRIESPGISREEMESQETVEELERNIRFRECHCDSPFPPYESLLDAYLPPSYEESMRIPESYGPRRTQGLFQVR